VALIFNSKQFAAYHARLAAKFKPTILRGMKVGAMRCIPMLVMKTRTAPPANPGGVGTGGAVDTGTFVRGWRVLTEPDGVTFTNMAPHSPVVEHGRRRGGKFPPRDALIAWIRRKITSPKPERRRKFGPKDSAEAARDKRDQARLKRDMAKVIRGNGDAPPRAKRPAPASPRAQRRERAGARGDEGGRRPATVSPEEQAARLYFPIARAIARRGLIGRKILTGHLVQQEILTTITNAVADELRKENAKP
jgi:hypothetical protein